MPPMYYLRTGFSSCYAALNTVLYAWISKDDSFWYKFSRSNFVKCMLFIFRLTEVTEYNN